MDFSAITNILASNSYDQIAQTCDNLMLQVASQGIAFREEWPYSIHLLGLIYVNDINSARFLWKSIPSALKDSQPELLAVWQIAQRLWTKDHSGVHEALRAFSWSPEVGAVVAAFSEIYTKRMFELLVSAYSTISVQNTAAFLGMTEDAAANYAAQQGWILDPESGMLTVKKPIITRDQKVDRNKLQRLTEYVFHLEH